MTSTTIPAAADAATDTHRDEFDQRYDTHLRHLRLKGLRPKTIEAYSRGIRRMGEYFDYRIDALGGDQLSRYFSDLLDSHSWSSVKLDLYSYKFYTEHVLGKPWVMPTLIKAPKVQRLPDIVTVEEAARFFAATRCLSYRVFTHEKPEIQIKVREGAGCAITEAPRGLLLHHYVLDRRGVVEKANIITPTAHNFMGLEENLRNLVQKYIHEKKGEITLKCEMLVRAYDPCFSMFCPLV